MFVSVEILCKITHSFKTTQSLFIVIFVVVGYTYIVWFAPSIPLSRLGANLMMHGYILMQGAVER